MSISPDEEPTDGRDYLLFQLYGPMASWGGVAMGEVRPTFDRPSKSAVLGMIGAALGIRQSEEEKHRELAETYGFAVRLDVPGRLLRDYHTTETPTGKRARGLPTRRDELEYKNTNTIESYRDYRCDARATVCLWAEKTPPKWPLGQIQGALQTPAFTLYLGRKSCPPALPMAPKITHASTLREAFAQSRHSEDSFTAGLMEGTDAVRFYWEETAHSGLDPEQVQSRRDQPVSRARWQFKEREECFVALPRSADAS